MEQYGVMEEHIDRMRQSLINGSAGWPSEVRIIYKSSCDWGFDVKDIKKDIPIYIFHGLHDPVAPIDGMKRLAKILPNCDATFWDDQGHMFALNSKCVSFMYDKFVQTIDEK